MVFEAPRQKKLCFQAFLKYDEFGYTTEVYINLRERFAPKDLFQDSKTFLVEPRAMAYLDQATGLQPQLRHTGPQAHLHTCTHAGMHMNTHMHTHSLHEGKGSHHEQATGPQPRLRQSGPHHGAHEV